MEDGEEAAPMMIKWGRDLSQILSSTCPEVHCLWLSSPFNFYLMDYNRWRITFLLRTTLHSVPVDEEVARNRIVAGHVLSVFSHLGTDSASNSLLPGGGGWSAFV